MSAAPSTTPPIEAAAASSDFVRADGLVRCFRPLAGRAFRRGTVRAVDGVSLGIARGEALGLVGESGCGKSTLGRLLLRLIEPDAGRVLVDGVDLGALGPGPLRRFRRRAQMVFQDASAALNPRMTVAALLAEPLCAHRVVERVAVVDEVARLLARVGLPPELDARLPHELSGGQRQRVGLARALAVRPRFLVLDEPTSALDVSAQARLVALLDELRRAEGLTLLHISHDLRTVRRLCERVAVMYLGRLVEQAPTTTLFDAPRHPYTQALLAAMPRLPQAAPVSDQSPLLVDGEPPSPAAPPSGCALHPRCPRYAALGRPARCREQAPVLRAADAAAPNHLVACHYAVG